MKSPREYYRKQHPNEFSDSQVEEVTDFDREVIDFALSSITTNNQEQAFERFCLRVCEVRICGNLIPNTGPAGGGDGKVDADTFPVADSVGAKYYEGVGREATNERWAIAVSANRAWKQKLQHDIKSIMSTGRPYGQIIFITNQSVPSRERQSTQDELSKQHRISVTMLDRTWLLDSIVYHNCAEFAIEQLGVNSAKKFKALPGPRDRKKRERLGELLSQIKESSDDKPNFLSVENALLAAKIARTLEEPQRKVESLFQGARENAFAFGTDAQRTEVEYQLAWTQFWWYEDYAGFLASYDAFIESLGTAPTFDGLSKWRNLWQIAAGAIRETNRNDKCRHTEQLIRAVEERMAACVPASTLQLNLRVLKHELDIFIALGVGKMPDASFAELAEILPEASRHLGFDFEGFLKWVEVAANAIPAVPAFDSLYDLTSSLQASRGGEVSAAKMQLDRAETLIRAGNHRQAVTRLCRAHSHLIKHETRTECLHCLYLLGNMYLRLELKWAARATFIAAAAIGLHYLMTDDELHPGLRLSLAQLRICAVTLGFLGESLTWHELTRHFHAITYQRLGDTRLIAEEESKFEILLGRLILRIPGDCRKGLESLPGVLDVLDLPIAADLARIKLGADLAILDYFPKPSHGSVLGNIYGMQAEMLLANAPEDVPVEPTSLSTTLFGCRFLFEYVNANSSRHLSEVLLTLIEPIFATASVGEVFAFQEQVVVRVDCCGLPGVDIELTRLDADPHVDFKVSHGDDVADKLRNDPATISQTLVECALLIGFGSLMSDSVIEEIEAKADATLFDRAYTVSRLISDMKYVTGDLDTLKLSGRLNKSVESFAISVEKWQPGAAEVQSTNEQSRNTSSSWNEEVESKRAESLGHSEISVISPIRGAQWDAAGWFGVLFAWSPYEQSPPLMALGFDNAEAGKAILAGWREQYGERISESLRISVIRGISKANPFRYRVLISGQFPSGTASSNVRHFQSVVRIHTMEAASPQNLQGFLDMFSFHGKFVLSTATRDAASTDEEWEALFARGIVMNGLIVRQAWEIGRHDPDVAGVFEDDDVIIPEDIETPPVMELLAWKRARTQ